MRVHPGALTVAVVTTAAVAMLSCVEAGPGRRSRSGVVGSAAPQLVLSRAWRELTFNFTGARTTQHQQLNTGRYIPANVLPVDVEYDTDERQRVFVVTPALRPGTPATLSVLSLADDETAPALQPYPSWTDQATTAEYVTNCDTQVISVTRTAKSWTNPDLLYAIDCGVVNIASSPERLCGPKIITFDLITDTMANSTQIAAYDPRSLHSAIQVDEITAGHPVAYTADLTTFRLTVTDLVTGESRRVESQYLYPSPGFGITDIAGQYYYLMYGVSTLALEDRPNGTLYTSAFSSNRLAAISTAAILAANDGDVLDLSTKVVVPGHRAGPSGAIGVDAAGSRLFFGIAEKEALYCWNTTRPYNQCDFRLLANDTEALQFFNSVKVQRNGERLWVLTNRFTKYLAGNIDNADVNYRLFYMNISNLTC